MVLCENSFLLKKAFVSFKSLIAFIYYTDSLVNRRVEQRQEHSITHTEITQR